jgi:hypothetical protein
VTHVTCAIKVTLFVANKQQFVGHDGFMQHIDDIATGKAFPGVDLTLWVQILVGAILVIAAGAWAIAAL